MDYNLTKALLLFFIYGFLGWCVEVAFAAVKHRKFVNRGFLNGPICPIYGFGLIGVVLLLRPLQGNLALLYLGSVIVTTLIELVTGWLLEKIFRAKWWDYSGMPLNIGGYVCLLFSMVWGLACLLIVKFIHPPIFALVNKIPRVLAIVSAALLSAVFIADIIATVAVIRNLRKRLESITRLAAEMHALSDNIGENIAEKTLAAVEKLEKEQVRISERRELSRELHEQKLADLRFKANALLAERGFGQRRLLEAFPNLKNGRHGEALEKLREAFRKRKPK